MDEIPVAAIKAIARIKDQLRRHLPAVERHQRRQRAKERLRSQALALGRQARLERLRRKGLPESIEGWLDRLGKLDQEGIPNRTSQDVAEGLLIIMDREAVDWTLWIFSDEPEDIEVMWIVREHALPYKPDAVKNSPALLNWVLSVPEPPKAKMGRPTEDGRNQEIVLTLLALQQLGVTVVRRDEDDGCELIAKRLGNVKHNTVCGIWKRRDRALARAMKKVL